MNFAMQYVKAKSNMGSYIRKFAGLPIYKGRGKFSREPKQYQSLPEKLEFNLYPLLLNDQIIRMKGRCLRLYP